MQTIATRVKTAREAAHYSQEALAIAAGLSRRTIQNVEAGHPPGAETMRSLMAVLDLGGETPEFRTETDNGYLDDVLPASTEAEWSRALLMLKVGFFGAVSCLPVAVAFALLGWQGVPWAGMAQKLLFFPLVGFMFVMALAALRGRDLRTDDDVDRDRAVFRERAARMRAESGATT